MAVDQRNLPSYFNSTADFQAWVQGLEAQFAAAGLTQTGDTGQINSASVAQPGAINTAAGYHMYRFNDAAQATLPVYIKVEFGTGPSVHRPSLWITCGTGSNGAGTLTGQVTARRQRSQNADMAAGNTLPSFCSGDGGRLALVTNYDTTNNNTITVIVDRIRDANNNVTTDAVVFICGDTYNNSNSVAVFHGLALVSDAQNSASGMWWGTSVGFGAGWVPGNGVLSFGGNYAIVPFVILLGQLRYLLSAIAYTGLAAGVAAAVTNLGGNHTYLPLPGIFNNLGAAGSNVAIIWE